MTHVVAKRALAVAVPALISLGGCNWLNPVFHVPQGEITIASADNRFVVRGGTELVLRDRLTNREVRLDRTLPSGETKYFFRDVEFVNLEETTLLAVAASCLDLPELESWDPRTDENIVRERQVHGRVWLWDFQRRLRLELEVPRWCCGIRQLQFDALDNLTDGTLRAVPHGVKGGHDRDNTVCWTIRTADATAKLLGHATVCAEHEQTPLSWLRDLSIPVEVLADITSENCSAGNDSAVPFEPIVVDAREVVDGAADAPIARPFDVEVVCGDLLPLSELSGTPTGELLVDVDSRYSSQRVEIVRELASRQVEAGRIVATLMRLDGDAELMVEISRTLAYLRADADQSIGWIADRIGESALQGWMHNCRSHLEALCSFALTSDRAITELRKLLRSTPESFAGHDRRRLYDIHRRFSYFRHELAEVVGQMGSGGSPMTGELTAWLDRPSAYRDYEENDRRRDAAIALGKIGASEELAAALDVGIVQALHGLQILDPTGGLSVERLMGMLQPEDPSVARWVVGWQSEEKICQMLAAHGEAASVAGPMLLAKLRNANPKYKYFGLYVHTLGKLGQRFGEETVDIILGKLREGSDPYEAFLIDLIGRFPASNRSAIPVLLKASQSGSESTRRAAVRALAASVTENSDLMDEVKTILVEALDDYAVRESAAMSLGSLGPMARDARASLIDAFYDEVKEYERIQIAEALASIDATVDAVRLLRGAIAAGDFEDYRSLAERTLREFGSREGSRGFTACEIVDLLKQREYETSLRHIPLLPAVESEGFIAYLEAAASNRSEMTLAVEATIVLLKVNPRNPVGVASLESLALAPEEHVRDRIAQFRSERTAFVD